MQPDITHCLKHEYHQKWSYQVRRSSSCCAWQTRNLIIFAVKSGTLRNKIKREGRGKILSYIKYTLYLVMVFFMFFDSIQGFKGLTTNAAFEHLKEADYTYNIL